MKKLFTLILLLTIAVINAQRVYITNNRNEADYICYITNNKTEADWVVKKTTWDSTARIAGNWKFVTNRNSADFVVYFTRNRNQADRIIFFTKWNTDVRF